MFSNSIIIIIIIIIISLVRAIHFLDVFFSF